MRTRKYTLLTVTFLIAAFVTQTIYAEYSRDSKKADQQNYITIRGKVVDGESGMPLVFASVSVQETNIATITNVDGEFIIKIGESVNARNLEFTHLGYRNRVLPLSEMKENGGKNVIPMQSAPIPIQEIIIRPMFPEEILVKAISLINKNYPTEANQMTSFYRETIRKNRTYVSIAEAVNEIFKAPYNNDLRFDATRIYKGRKNSLVDKMDTILFKLQGGPVTVLQLDLVKNPEIILTKDAMQYYDYSLTGVIEIDDRPHYVIDFIQKPDAEMPLFLGKFFIDTKTFAISEVEFGLNLSDKEAATPLFIRKKPVGMSVTPEIASYMVKYREQDGKWYFSYSRAEVKFKVNWKKKLFNTNYTTMSELAVTDRTNQEVIKFTGKERIRVDDIFMEEVEAFADTEFWGEYNVIEPDQSIEAAIRKLSRKLKFSDRNKE
jgi:hypothetical protein